MSLRPQIVRADTLDLQDHDAPSAKDHTSQPGHGDRLGEGPAAPHQDASLRRLERERHADQEYMGDSWGSGRSSHEGSELLEEDTDLLSDNTGSRQVSRGEDSTMQNTDGLIGTNDDTEGVDNDGDENLDDDMVDKISSSPSIDDGGSILTFTLTSEEQLLRYKNTTLRRKSSLDENNFPRKRFKYHHLGRKYSESTSAGKILESGLFLVECSSKTSMKGSRNLDKPEFGLHNFQYDGSSDSVWETVFNTSSDSSSDSDTKFASTSKTTSSSSAIIGGKRRRTEYSTQDDTLIDSDFPSDPRFIDSGWTGECLRETEDIDFEFVYALHTFVATVEGQANATKGDTMVLLDDSNSYWWLVRVVKDSSIGYLPAEHIETPTERLARLNKHRNIDLSQTMLGDNPEKPKNPIKKAMRRRQAKVVTFTAPTYYEPSDVDWSDGDDEPTSAEAEGDLGNGKNISQAGQDDASKGEKISTNTDTQTKSTAKEAETEANTDASSEAAKSTGTERQSEDSMNSQDSQPRQTRNGTMRNTDSFFKDNTAEPRKLTLTPNLLREESGGGDSPRSSESKEKTLSPVSDVFDQVERSGSIQEKERKHPRSKEKKSGMLSGLFKRKEKKIKVDEAAGGVVASSKHDGDLLASPSSLSSSENVASPIRDRPPSKRVAGGKLVKQPPTSSLANSSTTGELKHASERQPTPIGGRPSDGIRSPPPGMQRLVAREESTGKKDGKPPSLRIRTQQSNDSLQNDSPKRDTGLLSPLANLVSPNRSDEYLPKEEKLKKEKLKKAKQRMELDVDSSPEEPSPSQPQFNSDHHDIQSTKPPPTRTPPSLPAPTSNYYPEPTATTPPAVSPIDPRVTAPNYTAPSHSNVTTSTLGDSPVSVSTPNDSTPPDTPPTNSTVSRSATSLQDPNAPQSQDPSTTTHLTHTQLQTQNPTSTTTSAARPPPPRSSLKPNTTSSSTSTSTPTQPLPQWNDAALRHYLDSGTHASDVRHLLLIINSPAKPPLEKRLRKDHPVMKQLGFGEQERRLEDMGRELDGLLGGWIERRKGAAAAAGGGAGAVAAKRLVNGVSGSGRGSPLGR